MEARTDEPGKNDASVMVRMPQELKDQLMKAAFAAHRRITAEINLRLAKSLQMDPPLKRSLYGATPSPKEVASWDTGVKDRGTNYLEEDLTLSDTEREAFKLIRCLGRHQQQALLVLLRTMRSEGGIATEVPDRL